MIKEENFIWIEKNQPSQKDGILLTTVEKKTEIMTECPQKEEKIKANLLKKISKNVASYLSHFLSFEDMFVVKRVNRKAKKIFIIYFNKIILKFLHLQKELKILTCNCYENYGRCHFNCFKKIYSTLEADITDKDDRWIINYILQELIKGTPLRDFINNRDFEDKFLLLCLDLILKTDKLRSYKVHICIDNDNDNETLSEFTRIITHYLAYSTKIQWLDIGWYKQTNFNSEILKAIGESTSLTGFTYGDRSLYFHNLNEYAHIWETYEDIIFSSLAKSQTIKYFNYMSKYNKKLADALTYNNSIESFYFLFDFENYEFLQTKISNNWLYLHGSILLVQSPSVQF